MKPYSTPSPFKLSFPDGHTVDAVRAHRSGHILLDHPEDMAKLSALLESLGLDLPRPALVVVGGAGGITEEVMEDLRSLFVDVLAPLVESIGGVVVDGGTDSGVMKLMGVARQQTHGTFPLIGVAASGTVIHPALNDPPPEEGAPLEPNHTHFVIVPGAVWGDESPWIARVANAISQSSPSVTVLVNGGRITRQDAHNSVRASRPVIVLAGSGRMADEIAAASRGELGSEHSDLIESGLIHTIDVSADAETLLEQLKGMFSLSPSHQNAM